MKWPKSDEFSGNLIQTIQESHLSEGKWPPDAAAEQNLGDRLTSSPTIPYVVLASLWSLRPHSSHLEALYMPRQW